MQIKSKIPLKLNTRMATIKKTVSSEDKDVEKLKSSFIFRGTVKWYSLFTKQSGSLTQVKYKLTI